MLARKRTVIAYTLTMDAFTLLLVYLLAQNPSFKNSLDPLIDKLKQSQETLRFLDNLAAFPCTPNEKKPSNEQRAPSAPCSKENRDKAENGVNANGEYSANSSAETETSDSPLKTLCGEWLEKYVTDYLKS